MLAKPAKRIGQKLLFLKGGGPADVPVGTSIAPWVGSSQYAKRTFCRGCDRTAEAAGRGREKGVENLSLFLALFRKKCYDI